jgi:hypothetical protein
VKTKERIDGEVKIDLTLGGVDFFRAVLKCCANLFAAHDPAARASFLGAAFDPVRALVKEGAGQAGDFVRWITSPDPLGLPRKGEADQTILLTTRGGSVEGVMRFFGHLPFSVRLATGYEGPPVRCAYVVDPYREAEPAEERLTGDELAKYDEQVPPSPSSRPGTTLPCRRPGTRLSAGSWLTTPTERTRKSSGKWWTKRSAWTRASPRPRGRN